jgi:hypothetical protein
LLNKPTTFPASGGGSDTANRLAKPVEIKLSGDVSGSVNFDGSVNVDIATTVADDSHNHIITNVDGLESSLTGKVGIDFTPFGTSNSGTARWVKLCNISINGSYSHQHLGLLLQDRYGTSTLNIECLTGSAYNVGASLVATLISLENNGLSQTDVIIGQRVDTTNLKTYWDIWVNSKTWSTSLYKIVNKYNYGTAPTVTFYNDIYLVSAPTTATGYDSIVNPTYELYANGNKIWHGGNLAFGTSATNMATGNHSHDYQQHKLTNGIYAISASTDWNNYINTGFYMASGLLNAPPRETGDNAWIYVQVIKHNDVPWVVQTAWDFNGIAMWTRTCNNGTWGAWKKIWHSGNFDPSTKADTTVATSTANGLLSKEDKGKLDTISSFAKSVSQSTNNGYVLVDNVDTLVYVHPSGDSLTNPHYTTKADVGLGNVDDVKQAPSTRKVSAGNGLSGGGDLSVDRTLNLGTPSTITSTTTNAVTTTSHTHQLTVTKTDVGLGNVDNVKQVPSSRSVNTGVGLTGGGGLSADLTIALATPSTITSSTTNLASTNGHTHQLTVTKSDVGLSNVDDIKQAPSTRNITAGNGLSGGGDLSIDRTISLATPSTITSSTTNSVTASSHTHALTVTKSDVGLGSVENKSSATIRGEITSANITSALTYTPIKNGGSTPEIRQGTESAFPLATGTGLLFIATDTGKMYKDIASGTWKQIGGQEEIIPATTTTLGGIKVGANLSITSDGTLSANDKPSNFIRKQERFVKASGQTTFTLTKGSYAPNTGAIAWFLNGAKQSDALLQQLSSTTFGLPSSIAVGSTILVEYYEILSASPYPVHGSEHLTGAVDAIPLATTTTDGLMSATDKGYLNQGVKSTDSPTFANITFNARTVGAKTVGSVFTDGQNTAKTYINFSSASGSNDPSQIYHETSSYTADINKGVLHICPSDDNDNTNDYVAIHGTNDPETIRIYTGGNVTTTGSFTASGGFLGNASSATKLQTARKINGVSFDGQSDITIDAGTSITISTTAPAVHKVGNVWIKTI